MERGQLGIDNHQSTVFVFDGLIGNLLRPRTHRALINMRQWEYALDLWEFDIKVCDYISALMSRYGLSVDVLTWQPQGFANALQDKLWKMRVPVQEVRSSTYRIESPHAATDDSISVVFDGDLTHRMGYGYKAREFDPRKVF